MQTQHAPLSVLESARKMHSVCGTNCGLMLELVTCPKTPSGLQKKRKFSKEEMNVLINEVLIKFSSSYNYYIKLLY